MKARVAVTMGLVLTLVIVGAMVSCKKSEARQRAQSSSQTAQTSTEALPQPNPERNVYFGETHLHTSWSLDAWMFGDRMTGPDNAYKYSQGRTIKHPLGYDIHIETPLDFMRMTDLSEYVGVTKQANTPGSYTSKLPAAPGGPGFSCEPRAKTKLLVEALAAYERIPVPEQTKCSVLVM